ncbi:putative inactive deoxyuridine 5'-triphosphate nucleotidohydrolase-like protein FLJ16323 [Manis javanica]|nr:putative inactive deoxyuridine 5'-triphosphate nucleotidohydrolase-like protein FLJ16323 [Manis javanica]
MGQMGIPSRRLCLNSHPHRDSAMIPLNCTLRLLPGHFGVLIPLDQQAFSDEHSLSAYVQLNPCLRLCSSETQQKTTNFTHSYPYPFLGPFCANGGGRIINT